MDLTRATYLILAEGSLGSHISETAAGAIRYLGERVSALIDSTNAGRTAQEVLGFGGEIPIVASLEDGLGSRLRTADTLLVATGSPRSSPAPEVIDTIVEAARRGLDIVSGLDTGLKEVPEVRDAALESRVTIFDLYQVPEGVGAPTGSAGDIESFKVLMVGTDTGSDGLTAALETRNSILDEGEMVYFVPTSEAGILIEGWGIAVGAIDPDRVAGAAEHMVQDAADMAGPDGVILIEGQGSLAEPGSSSIALGLLQGTLPDALILYHTAEGAPSEDSEGDGQVERPSLPRLIELYQGEAGPERSAQVVAIALETSGLTEDDALKAIEEAAEETGLPVTDPVRFGAARLAEAVVAAKDRRDFG